MYLLFFVGVQFLCNTAVYLYNQKLYQLHLQLESKKKKKKKDI